ncbi:MAG: hypothetical protein GPOALKHO_000592 [Sodalis sp.]|nr:MAG: hypothetical protein GPOALKHO_000592 [Sodalis sp.]
MMRANNVHQRVTKQVLLIATICDKDDTITFFQFLLCFLPISYKTSLFQLKGWCRLICPNVHFLTFRALLLILKDGHQV